MSTTPAGWYDDGQHPGQLRFWDGEQWTEQYRPHADLVTNTVPTADRPVGPVTFSEDYDPRHAVPPGPIPTWVWLGPLLVVAGAGLAVAVLWLFGAIDGV